MVGGFKEAPGVGVQTSGILEYHKEPMEAGSGQRRRAVCAEHSMVRAREHAEQARAPKGL